MMNYLALNIGRNVGNLGDTPMSDTAWATFQEDAAAALTQHAVTTRGKPATIVARGTVTGDGAWKDTVEESAVVWLVTSDILDTFSIRDLHQAAKQLARRYQQDAVAVIGGESTLAEA